MTLLFSACGEKANYTDVYDLGTYNNYNVVIRKYDKNNVADVVVDVYVAENYICSLPDGAYKIVVCASDGGTVSLQKAYECGYITDDDLITISQKAQATTKLSPSPLSS
jgi:hypothetical protein